jgi:hypothetical protein
VEGHPNGTQSSAEGRNPTFYASISVFKELALWHARARASLYRISFAYVKRLFGVEASKHLSVIC